ncbi:copper resistance CopC family protein [Arthrobacter silvisoli]|uniref:copper resistance CopC family protein n=1 Tax=Arthrobacter silvisoli TaxID=2291022 RepID=UPI000E20FAF1|nr:copper resistance CopC family protein [Arthrobacter silvisoli]
MRPVRQLVASALAAFLFTATVLFGAAPASAHDKAESSSPADGSTVATVPDSVSVTFNNRPLALGASIAVFDASGKDWADGPVEMVDTVVSQKLLPGAPAGKYTVEWRVASSDGHPINGTVTFTARAGSTTPGGGTGSSSPSSGASAGAVPSAGTVAPGSSTTPEKTPDASEPFPWSIVGFAVVALALLVFLGVTARRKLAAGGDAESDDETAEE